MLFLVDNFQLHQVKLTVILNLMILRELVEPDSADL